MLNEEKLKKYYYKSLLIRQTEKKIEELFKEGKLRGTTHGYIGQEIIAVSLLDKIDIKKDYVTGTHRSHGHYLALFEDPYGLISELMGKNTGLINGKGGSQHLYRDNFITNGITGGMIPIGTGIAMAKKYDNSDSIVISFLGDGAMNEGYVYESFNFAKVNELPILFALENNQYAMSTSINDASSGNFKNRVNSFDIKTFYVETTNYKEAEKISGEAVKYIRKELKPCLIHFNTYRFCGHSKSDKCEYRDNIEEKYWFENDSLKKIEKEISEKETIIIKKKVENLIDDAIIKAEKDAFPDPELIYEGEAK